MSQNERSQWDIGKFIRTLAYFEILPFFSCLQRLIQGRLNHNKDRPTRGESVGLVLVAGATGGVGKRVVQRLIEENYQVRALVRDTQRARGMLSEEVELFEGDITLPETLTPEMMRNVTAVICCTGVKVQPVEGDTPDREKYYQGIKFYMPEVVDSPEIVDYQGIKSLVQVAVQHFATASGHEKLIFDFTNPSSNLQETWGAVDDVVMGGVSESHMQFVENTALFAGNVSTANSGGFASVRTRNFAAPMNLSGYEGVALRVRGDGQRYKFLLRTEAKWDGVAYSYAFDTVAHTWLTIRIPFADMVPVFRAKTIKDYPTIDPSKICSVQLMLSKFEYNGALNPKFQPGGFSLQVESMKTYGGPNLPLFVQVSSAGVTRPGRPGLNLAEEPPAVRMNDQLGGILTWKLRGEESVRTSGLPYTIIRPCALTEETGVQKLIFDQGDNIKGKVSRDSIAALCVKALRQPKACYVTFEAKQAESSERSNDWEALFDQLQADREIS